MKRVIASKILLDKSEEKMFFAIYQKYFQHKRMRNICTIFKVYFTTHTTLNDREIIKTLMRSYLCVCDYFVKEIQIHNTYTYFSIKKIKDLHFFLSMKFTN